MIYPKKSKLSPRKRRAQRVRQKVFGSQESPRLSVHRSLKNIYAQIIDDVKGHTLVALSSSGPEIRKMNFEGGKVAVARSVGKLLAEKAKEKGITKVVFDRGGYLFHGRIKGVAEGALEGGLKI